MLIDHESNISLDEKVQRHLTSMEDPMTVKAIIAKDNLSLRSTGAIFSLPEIVGSAAIVPSWINAQTLRHSKKI